MNEKMKLAAIGAVTVIAAVGLFSYCSPYQTCVRAGTAQNLAADEAFQQTLAEGGSAADGAMAAAMGSVDADPPEPLTHEQAERNAQLLCAKAT